MPASRLFPGKRHGKLVIRPSQITLSYRVICVKPPGRTRELHPQTKKTALRSYREDEVLLEAARLRCSATAPPRRSSSRAIMPAWPHTVLERLVLCPDMPFIAGRKCARSGHSMFGSVFPHHCPFPKLGETLADGILRERRAESEK